MTRARSRHCERVAHDPHGIYRWHKNRKKTIRQAYQRGRLTPGERAELLAEALKIKREMRQAAQTNQPHTMLEARRESAASHELAKRLIADGRLRRPHIENCNEECVSARGYHCRCPCDGQNHGVANGTSVWQVTVYGRSLAERVAAGELSEQDLGRRAQWQAAQEWDRLMAARRARLPGAPPT